MNLSDIITKCYILALIIRDDGERLLLGDGIYEFKSNLQHFTPNIYQNDVVELQGTDGQLLAGQVRRSATQAFDGYIADGTIGKTDTEQSRRRFLGFFRKKHHYKVIYIMPDGTAVQRDRGYIVDAPAVQELYQRFPEYHIGLNFEDPNYYEYDENGEGEEIYTHIQAIALFRELEAGLVWDAFGAVSDDIVWAEYMTENSTDGYILIGNGLPVESPLSLTHLYGNATQQTYSGKNLLNPDNPTTTSHDITLTNNGDGSFNISGTSNAITTIGFSASYSMALKAGQTYSISANNPIAGEGQNMQVRLHKEGGGVFGTIYLNGLNATGQYTPTEDANFYLEVRIASGYAVPSNFMVKPQVELGATATDFEPYVGGVPSPNPSYPQDVNVVSGAQTVRIVGKNIAGIVSHTNTSHGMTYGWNEDGTITLNGTTDATSSANATGDFLIRLKAGQTYTFSANNSDTNANITVRLERGNGQSGVFASEVLNTANKTWTFAGEDTDCRMQIRIASGITLNNFTFRPQLELGNQASDFEPYQAQSQEINLGALELAKIGDYQDYIWNDEGTWKIHKEVGKVVLDGGEGWGISQTGTANYFYRYRYITGAYYHSGMDYWLCNLATPNVVGTSNTEQGGFMTSSGELRVRYGAEMPIADWRTFLSTNNMIIYYALATPTDEEITDSELIEQLNHIYELYQGTNNLWLIPSAGAQGEMTVRFGVAYDDDGSGYHWSEELGSPDNIISNDGIDSVRPIWVINGPATNPTLTNITTAQTITWNGTVPADATLTIDMERQTATLNGANVYAQIEGDWLELAVGPNKLQYTASGGATADSTLEWNGVAG